MEYKLEMKTKELKVNESRTINIPQSGDIKHYLNETFSISIT